MGDYTRMTWTQRGIILCPQDTLTDAHKDALAQAFVETVSLETFANERLMFEKAARYSGDFGATETHAAIHTALTPELADAIRAALVGVSGLWYILDADTGALLDTNDAAKLDVGEVVRGLDWQPDMDVVAGEVLRHNGTLCAVIQAHHTQADWPPDVARSLFMQYRAPGEVSAWVQPTGAQDAWADGARVTHAGQTWRSLIPDNTTEPGSDPRWWECEDCETTTEWAVGVAYKGDNTEGAGNGDIVTYQGAEYRCLQSHTSQAGWTPSAVPALWLLISPA